MFAKNPTMNPSIDILCFDEKCRNDNFMCLKCLPLHNDNVLVSIDNLIEALGQALPRTQRLFLFIKLRRFLAQFISIHKYLGEY